MKDTGRLTPAQIEALRNRMPTEEELKAAREFIKTLGPLQEFKPCAHHLLNEVHVFRKDCSYTAKFVNTELSLFYENHRPGFNPLKHYVGFSVYCPRSLGLTGTVAVQDVLRRVEAFSPEAFGRKGKLVRRLAGDLKVKIEESA